MLFLQLHSTNCLKTVGYCYFFFVHTKVVRLIIFISYLYHLVLFVSFSIIYLFFVFVKDAGPLSSLCSRCYFTYWRISSSEGVTSCWEL